MKLKHLAVLVITAIAVVAHAGKTMHSMGAGFVAPQVNGVANVTNPTAGEIVYDSSTSTFQGYLTFGTVSTWAPIFVAPQVSGTSSIANPRTGEIVFDTTSGSFQGYSTAGTVSAWGPLSGSGGLPPGMVFTTAASSCPAGSIPADGSGVAWGTYINLQNAIGTSYGGTIGVGYTLPNLQGLFVRGAGAQTLSNGVTYTGTQGVTTADLLQGHHHDRVDGGHSHTVSTSQSAYEWLTTLNGGASQVVYSRNSNANNGAQALAPGVGITVNSSNSNITVTDPLPDGVSGTPRTGAETRPANIALLNCIVY